MRILASLISLGLTASTLLAINTFPLTDLSPQSDEYRKRFLGSFGINSAIEPTLTQDDRPLYESIEPFLQKNPQEAIRLALKGINSDTNAAFEFLVGSLYYSQDNFVAAETYLKKAISKFPDFRRAHRTLALIYIQENDYKRCIEHLLTVIALGGGDDQSYGMLAHSYLQTEKYQSALSAYELARVFRPDSVDLRRGQAQCLLMTDQTSAAIALFSELIAEEPQNGDYWLFQANAYLAEDRLEDALANLEIASSLGKSSFDTYKLLGDIYLTQDIPELAVKNYSSAIEKNPMIKAKTAFTPLQMLIQRGLLPEAKIYYNTLTTQLKTELTADQILDKSVMLAQIQMQEEKPEQAITTLEGVLKTNPVHTDALLTLADTHLQLEQYEQSEFYFERASHIPNVRAKALVGLGRIKVQIGDLEGALTHLENAQQIDPRDNVKRFITSIENALTAQR